MRSRAILAVLVVTLMLVVQACGGGGSSVAGSGPTGGVTLSLVDAPGDFDNVFITVGAVWFHRNSTAGPGEGGWLRYPLAAPVTVDLMTLADGNMSSAIWDNIQLPVGTYQQIRLLLVPTSAANPPAGHSYFNEVVISGTTYPLRIPDAEHGIGLVGMFRVSTGGDLRLAIDFDAGHDIVELRNGEEYVMKPRLAYFDLDNAGAIIGRISTDGTFTTTPRFVIKAERLNADGTYHVVKRSTVPDATGRFVLYPVSAQTTTTYDLVLRGIGYQTTIIKGVPVVRGTTPVSALTTTVPLITMATGTDYDASASVASPTGAWVNFYQTLPGAGEAPYDIRFRHFHPLTGSFAGFMLSNSALQVGTYAPGLSSTATSTVIPLEGIGSYKAAADAMMYDRSGYASVTAMAPNAAFGSLSVTAPWTGNTVSGNITLSMPGMMNNKMDKGILFAVHGGMIVNAMDVSSLMAGGGVYTLPALPGGTVMNPQPGAVYGIDAIGWSSTIIMNRSVAVPVVVDLSTGGATADMRMMKLW